mgnify:CR=1 FL=1
MSILKVARMGHPVLRERARPLEPDEIGTPRIQRLIDDMFETMHDSQGIGLAGPQVHEKIRLFVAGVEDEEVMVPPVVIINPEITPIGSDVEEDWEGCLSVPDIRGRGPRAVDVRIRALDRHGRPVSMAASGFQARVIQHEIDHLDGVLFFDRMTSFESLTFLEEYSRYWATQENG